MTANDLTMTQARIICALFFGAVVAWRVLRQEQQETTLTEPKKGMPRYGSVFPVYALPLLFLVALFLGLIDLLTGDDPDMAVLVLSSVLLICLYDCLLLPLLPLLRKFLSARACATLWLVPSFLYAVNNLRFPRPYAPLVILPVSRPLLIRGILIWTAGGVGVLLWSVLSHKMFRARLLADATPITDPDILAVWKEELDYAGGALELSAPVYSSQTATPLTVGLLLNGLQVVLPHSSYTPEQLRLIFRHELVHICRQDSWNKFFLLFCAAVSWFNPLMWVSMKKCAEDLELSCDETVLLGADEYTRRQYAHLLLNTAGDSRGFTTCLAADARSMRYRLKNVVRERRPIRGGLLAGLVIALLLLSNGYVSVGYDVQTVGELMSGQGPLEEFSVRKVSSGSDHFPDTVHCVDPEGLLNYLAGLECARVAGGYDGPRTEISIGVEVDTPNGVYYLAMNQGALNFYLKSRPAKEDLDPYFLMTEVDWDYVHSTLLPR